ncbi:MAG: Nif3-like dinuclear metal center protein, partial [Thalassolituus maritimus]
MAVTRKELISHLDHILQSRKIRDYCPNGLQVSGNETIQKVVTGVTANQALIEAAIAEEADAIFVHHGYFWKGEDECITGIKKERIKALLLNDINLIAYHLPLDMHPIYGNNIQLADVLGIQVDGPLDESDPSVPGNIGRLPRPMTGGELSAWIAQCLQREPLHIGESGDT